MVFSNEYNKEALARVNNKTKWSIREVISESWELTKTRGVKSGIWGTAIKCILIYLIMALIFFLLTSFFAPTDNIASSIKSLETASGGIWGLIVNTSFVIVYMLIGAFVIIKTIDVIKTNNADYTNLLGELKSYLITAKMFFVLLILCIIILELLKSCLSLIFLPHLTNPSILLILAASMVLLGMILGPIVTYILAFTLTNILLNDIGDFNGAVNKLVVCTKTILSRPFSYLFLTTTVGLITSLLAIFIIPLIWLIPFSACVFAVLYTKENFDK
ncbi:MAG: hypothetical protein ACOX3T_00125 [Bdellovibrionota bacterium]